SVPMTVALERANQAFRTFMVSLGVVFVVAFLALNLALSVLIIRPIIRMASAADQVSIGNMQVPEFAPKGRDEIATLATSFNRLRGSREKALPPREWGAHAPPPRPPGDRRRVPGGPPAGRVPGGAALAGRPPPPEGDAQPPRPSRPDVVPRADRHRPRSHFALAPSLVRAGRARHEGSPRHGTAARALGCPCREHRAAASADRRRTRGAVPARRPLLAADGAGRRPPPRRRGGTEPHLLARLRASRCAPARRRGDARGARTAAPARRLDRATAGPAR